MQDTQAVLLEGETTWLYKDTVRSRSKRCGVGAFSEKDRRNLRCHHCKLKSGTPDYSTANACSDYSDQQRERGVVKLARDQR